MELNDVYNWQLGQYIKAAYGDILAGAFGKHSDMYPKEPLFSKELLKSQEEKELLSEKQKELETLKFQEFFTNLGSHVAIKKKGGRK